MANAAGFHVRSARAQHAAVQPQMYMSVPALGAPDGCVQVKPPFAVAAMIAMLSMCHVMCRAVFCVCCAEACCGCGCV
jgi:hypothetical protein